MVSKCINKFESNIPTSDLHLSKKQREIFDSDDSVPYGKKCLFQIKQKYLSKSLFNNLRLILYAFILN